MSMHAKKIREFIDPEEYSSLLQWFAVKWAKSQNKLKITGCILMLMKAGEPSDQNEKMLMLL